MNNFVIKNEIRISFVLKGQDARILQDWARSEDRSTNNLGRFLVRQALRQREQSLTLKDGGNTGEGSAD